MIFFGSNGESDPVKMFKYYRSIGKIGSEWNISGETNSADHYVLTLNHGNDKPRIRYSLNLTEVKQNQTVNLEAGLGYEMSAEILYMPQWMQKLKDAGRIKFYFFGRLCNPGVQVGYEDAYLYDFYVDRIGKHHIEFYWVCKSATDPDDDTFRFASLLKDYELTDAGTLYYERFYFDVQMDKKVGGTRYIYKVELQQANGEFTEETSATHKISMHPETLANCYHIPWDGIPSEWEYSSIDDAYVMDFYLRARHGYEFSGSSVLASKGITLNVQHTEVSNKKLVKGSSDRQLSISLVAKRRLTDVRGTLKNFRYGVDSSNTEIVSNEPKKYTFKNVLVYDDYNMEASFFDEESMYQIYFNVEPGFGYYLPKNASVKVIRPAGYGNHTEHDPITYSTLYKDNWIEESAPIRKYRTERWLEPTSEMKVYGTNILIQEPKAGDRPAAFADYEKPTSLPYNMKVLSMQWLGPDQKPMRKFDKFEIGKSYFLDLRIGFEGGEELGYVYPKNYRDFKVNGKSVNAWMEYENSTDGHVWQMYDSYKLVDPNASGTLSGTVKSYNSASDKVTIQLIQQGHSEPAYETTVSGGTKEGNQYTASYTISGIASGTYTMKVSKKNHVTREYTVTVGAENVTQDVEIWLLGDVNGDGTINAKDKKIIYGHINDSTTELTGYIFDVGDVNKDGVINAKDKKQIFGHINGTSLWS